MEKTKKLLSNILLICMCIGIFTAIPTKTFAVNSLNMTQVKSWLDNEISSKQTRGSGECVDFCNYYLTNCWGNASIGGNAGSWKNKCPEGWTVVNLNGSFDNCRIGDLLVEDYYPYGHVSVYYGKEGGKHYVVDQNNNGRRNTDKGRLWANFSNPMYCFRPPIGSTPTPVNISVNFSPWDNGNFTYVRETDASIGQEINVSGGTCTDTGMYLYDANGNLLAKAANGSYYYRIYFKINEELGYTLTSGTVYKYKFYAIVNGQTYWSNEYSFKTDGPTPTAVSTDVSGACGIEEGTYTLTPACATGSRLDIANASTDSGANVQLHSANGTIAQEFIIESVGKPYYKIVAKCSGMVLDVQGALTDSGTNVFQHPYHGGSNEQWIFVDAGDGYYYIRPANNTNLSLDVWNGDSADGTNIWVYNSNRSNAQKWKLNKVVTDTENPVISNVKITDITEDGYTVSCSASDNVGVTKVEFPTWTLNTGADGSDQDDLIWHLGIKNGNTYSYRVKASEHNNETNIEYRTHIYAWDAAGNKSAVAAEDVYVGEKSETIDTQPTQTTTDEDYVRIVSVSPQSVKYGDSVTFTANVEYSLQSKDEGVIYLGVNTEERRSYKLYDEYMVSKGTGKAKLSATVTVSSLWDTVVYVNISAYPHEYSWDPLETDKINIDSYKENDANENNNKTGTYSFRFPRTNVYHQDQFDDVKANQWFSQNVADAFEMGLVKGISNTEFNPYGDVTVAEAITMAARIHSIYTTGNENFTSNGGMWYQVYLDYAYESGVISRAYYNSDVSQKATRAQFAEIFANAMDDKGFYEINAVKDNAIPDVKMTALYADDVYKLYRAGILAGNDVLGTFSPDTYITRAEVSAILSRMADTSNRLTFTMK